MSGGSVWVDVEQRKGVYHGESVGAVDRGSSVRDFLLSKLVNCLAKLESARRLASQLEATQRRHDTNLCLLLSQPRKTDIVM
jgi:vacuolar-type H+-ATPase subunit D/Vma8